MDTAACLEDDVVARFCDGLATAESPKVRERLRREATILAPMTSTNVVRLHATGELPTGSPAS